MSTLRERITKGMGDGRVIRAVKLATLRRVELRAAALGELRDAEAVRELAARIKQHTLDRLPDYLEEFVGNVERNGGRVHFARDAEEARGIVCGIAAGSFGIAGEKGRVRASSGTATSDGDAIGGEHPRPGVPDRATHTGKPKLAQATRAHATLAVKSKSMTTEEIHLNGALEAAGVKVVETDLGEFIVQIDRDTPSHIVTPIIHKDRKQVAVAMQRELGCEYTEDPRELTMIARRHLRDVFRRCDLGISGVNFAVAETGTICICTNEGNGRLTTTRPRVHVALMGIEKIIPRMCDLPVFLKLLARSATGQPITVYTNLITGPKRTEDADGPEEVHVVLMDNGRSDILCGPFAEVLRCIRCGACLNACPVYRNVGGHAYGSVYPGPIGSLVTPLLEEATKRRSDGATKGGEEGSKGPRGRGTKGAKGGTEEGQAEDYFELPRASSLCGACYSACPVKIDIPKYLVMLRGKARGLQPFSKRVGMKLWMMLNRSARLYSWSQWCMRRLMGRADSGWVKRGPGPLGAWTAARDLPAPPAESFRRRWKAGLKDER